MRKTTTGRMTKVVLLISFIILVGRLLYAAIAAIPHHQEKDRCLNRRPRKPAWIIGDYLGLPSDHPPESLARQSYRPCTIRLIKITPTAAMLYLLKIV